MVNLSSDASRQSQPLGFCGPDVEGSTPSSLGAHADPYRRLIEASRDLIWSVDSAGRWTFVNGACRAIYGVAPEVLIGRSFADFVVPAQLVVDQQVFARLLAGENIINHETRHVRADGSIAEMVFNAEPLRDRSGQVIGSLGTAQDITVRRRAERLVHESEWRFRKLVELSPDAIVIVRAGLVAFFNPAAGRLVGRRQFVGCDLLEVVVPGDRPLLADAISRVMREGVDVPRCDVRLSSAGGETVAVEVSCGPFSYDGDDAVLLVARDITARKSAEEALARELAYNEHIVQTLPLFICGVAPDGTTLFANPAVCRSTGYREDELRGKSWWTTFYPGPEFAQVEKLMQRFESGNVNDYVMTLRAKDGSRRTVSWNSINRADPYGNLQMIIGIGRDITDQLALEAQLNHSQKLESIGHLAAGIAHEINTPTQFVGDNLRFLRDAFVDLAPLLASSAAATALKAGDAEYLREEIPKAIEQSIEGVSRVASIVRAMKDFSHPDHGERVPVDLNHAINTTLTVARNEYKYVADLETDLDGSLPPVTCMVGEINQTVLNLVVNAAHAIAERPSPQGRGRITVATRRCGAEVEIRVADTGNGIPDHVRPRIFDPFFTTKPVGKGTGQGLFIAHSVVVKKHSGSISFETELGRGTTFIIRLPIEAAPLAPGA